MLYLKFSNGLTNIPADLRQLLQLEVFSLVEGLVCKIIVCDPVPVTLRLANHKPQLSPSTLFFPLFQVRPPHLHREQQTCQSFILQTSCKVQALTI